MAAATLDESLPYLVIDARYEKIRCGGEVIPHGVLLVVGISQDGYREVLGVWRADSENETSWAEVFAELKEPGLEGVRFVVSDDHRGLVKAIVRYFQGAVWQRCQVRFVRNVLHAVSLKDRREVLELLKGITESGGPGPGAAGGGGGGEPTGPAVSSRVKRQFVCKRWTIERAGESSSGDLPPENWSSGNVSSRV